jgi:hypothetical protein
VPVRQGEPGLVVQGASTVQATQAPPGLQT